MKQEATEGFRAGKYHAMTEILKRLLYEENELSGINIKQRFLWLELH